MEISVFDKRPFLIIQDGGTIENWLWLPADLDRAYENLYVYQISYF